MLKQGVNLSDVYQTLQSFMGGVMVNYFNRFGRVWQVYVQAEGNFARKRKTSDNSMSAMRKAIWSRSRALVTMDTSTAPSSRCATTVPGGPAHAGAASGYSSGAGDEGVGGSVCASTMPTEWATIHGHVVSGKGGGGRRAGDCASSGFSLLFVFLILAAQYESWALPFSVLLGTPIAVFGAFGALWLLSWWRLRRARTTSSPRSDWSC